jgi:hypothetical protein
VESRSTSYVRLPRGDVIMTVWNDLLTYEEYVPLGTFWSLDWDSPDDSLEATVTARDRMELLRKGTFQTSVECLRWSKSLTYSTSEK